MHRNARLALFSGLLSVVCASLFACDSADVIESSTSVGAYRLTTINGASVPVADPGLLVRSGDVVLRENGSAFGLVRSNSFYANFYFDRYRIAGDKIEFSRNDTTLVSGTIAGDSILVNIEFYAPYPFSGIVRKLAVFRRTAPDPVAIREGTYVLTNVDSRPLVQQPAPGFAIEYDTLTFTDGVFYRRSRKEGYQDSTRVLQSYTSYSMPGTYRGNANYLLLGAVTDSSRTVAAPTRDSLIVDNGALILRSWGVDGRVRDNRYEKRP